MVHMIRLQKGELWRPGNFNCSELVSVRVAKGTGWMTFKCSNEDRIYQSGQILELDEKEPLLEALSEELDLEIELRQLKMKKIFSFL